MAIKPEVVGVEQCCPVSLGRAKTNVTRGSWSATRAGQQAHTGLGEFASDGAGATIIDDDHVDRVAGLVKHAAYCFG
jgi:hypothetical protein